MPLITAEPNSRSIVSNELCEACAFSAAAVTAAALDAALAFFWPALQLALAAACVWVDDACVCVSFNLVVVGYVYTHTERR